MQLQLKCVKNAIQINQYIFIYLKIKMQNLGLTYRGEANEHNISRSMNIYNKISEQVQQQIQALLTNCTSLKQKNRCKQAQKSYSQNLQQNNKQQSQPQHKHQQKPQTNEQTQSQNQYRIKICNIEHVNNNVDTDRSQYQKIKHKSKQSQIQRNIIRAKNTIMRILGSKIIQFDAIQQKYKNIVVEINEELEASKNKYKQLFNKFQKIVLDIDKYKVQTVQISQLYELANKQNLQLKKQIRQLNRVKNNKSSLQLPLQQNVYIKGYNFTISTMSQTDQSINILTSSQYAQLSLILDQNKQQKQLFHQQLSKLNKKIEQYKQNQSTANDRIQNLLIDNQKLLNDLQENKLIIIQLKKQIDSCYIQIQQLTVLQKHIKQQADKRITNLERNWQKQKQSMTKHLKQKQKIISIMQSIQLENKSQITSNSQKIRTLLQKIDQEQIKIKEKDKQIQNYQLSQTTLTQTLLQLQSQTPKLTQISKNQSLLQQKYSKKLALVNKQLKQQSQKLKFYKNQNERLYEAMQQFANKQIKLNNNISVLEKKITKNQHQQKKIYEIKSKFICFIHKANKQILSIKNYIQLLLKNIKAQFNTYTQLIKNKQFQIKSSYATNLQNYQNQWKTKFQDISNKYEKAQTQLFQLKQKIVKSQLNSNLIAGSLMQSKNQIISQLSNKDKIIQSLQNQLKKQRQINDASTKKIAEAVKKFEKTKMSQLNQRAKIQNKYAVDCTNQQQAQLQNKLIQQKHRFAILQRQYQASYKYY